MLNPTAISPAPFGALGGKRFPPPCSGPTLPPLQAPRLLDQLRERIRFLHYSLRREEAYVHWCKAFIRFHGKQHPKDLGGADVEAFLTWLASDRQVAASTHRQALSALLFLYGKVLVMNLPWMQDIGRPQVKRRLPVVQSREEVAAVFRHLDGEHLLFAQMLYGTGLRLTEGFQLRVKDVDFAHNAIVVREGKGSKGSKGSKDRIVMLPQVLVAGLRGQLARSHDMWLGDRANEHDGVEMPNALDRKYPRAGSSWAWFWVFPQATHSTDPRSGVVRRGAASPPLRPDVSASVQKGGDVGGHHQAGLTSH